jgi:hypothetical protein
MPELSLPFVLLGNRHDSTLLVPFGVDNLDVGRSLLG